MVTAPEPIKLGTLSTFGVLHTTAQKHSVNRLEILLRYIDQKNGIQP
jgi:hypothetical protein